MTVGFTWTLGVLLLAVVIPSSLACRLDVVDNNTRLAMEDYLDDHNVKLIEYELEVEGYSRDFWTTIGGDDWFQPWIWYRAKGADSERLLLLYHYYYGLLKPYLGIGSRSLHVKLVVNDTLCLAALSPRQMESTLRNFLYYDLKNDTERLTAAFTSDIRVCSMHIGDYGGWGRLVYRCCWRNDAGDEGCSDVSDDVWVWVLRTFIILFSALLFLYFPSFIPKGYYIYSFYYYPPDGQSFRLIKTDNPDRFKGDNLTTVLPPARWRKMRQFAGEVGKLQAEVIHKVRVQRVTYECGMDRLLSETSSPVSAFRSVFDSLVRCKVRHADPLEDCCNTPVCGDLCCPSCPPWHLWLRAIRTVVVMLLMALPALPILYAMAADSLEYQQVAHMFEDRGLDQSYNFYVGSIVGKTLVAVLSLLYVVHMLLLVVDGWHDENLSRAYTSLLQVTSRKAQLSDRIRQSNSIIHKAFWPIKRFGVLAIPAGLLLLALLPVGLLLYLIFTSPVPKMLVHVVRLIAGKDPSRTRKTKAEMTSCRLVENVLFIVSLVGVFAVLTLSLNFLLHLAVILLIQLIVDLSFVLKFLTVVALLLVYIRDSFKVVNNTYSSHHSTVLRHVLAIEAEDIQREADKDWSQQESKIFKIVPQTALDPKGAKGKEQEAYNNKKLFFMKNGAFRMRTRSLVLFLDKDDIPYIPKKFLFHTTTMACPGCPGPLDEAYLAAAMRFGKTVVFLLFIMLVVMAYADTHFVSPDSAFFVMLFTGAFPLVLRYFFLNPGSVVKVDQSTLRFRTQMDDKIESFMQSWAVEDLKVGKFSLPKDNDRLDKAKDKNKAKDANGTANHASINHENEGDPKSEAKRNRHKPAPVSSPPKQNKPIPTAGIGHVNYMFEPSGIGDEDGGDMMAYNHDHLAFGRHEAEESAAVLQDQPLPSSDANRKKKKKDKKKKKKHEAEEERGWEGEGGGGGGRGGSGGGEEGERGRGGEGEESGNMGIPLVDDFRQKATSLLNNVMGTREECGGDKKAKMKCKTKRIDLVLDTRGVEREVDHVPVPEGGGEGGRHPGVHWTKRSRLVKEGGRGGESNV